MAFYKTCPDCGAHLDSGERCDCQDEVTKPDTHYQPSDSPLPLATTLGREVSKSA